MYRSLIRRLALCAFLLSLFVLSLPAMAHADGGAPNLAYVAGSNGVSVIDVMQQKVVSTINAPGDPRALSLSMDGRFLYVAQSQRGQVAIVIAKTGETFCTAAVPGQPSLLALDTANKTLYAAGNGSESVSAIDPESCAIRRTLHLNSPVYGLAISVVGTSVGGGSGNQLWVASQSALTIFDGSNDKELSTISVPEGPRYLTIPGGGGMAYATTQQGSVIAVDLNSHAIQPLISGGEYGPMDYNAGSGEIYVPDLKNEKLIVLSPVNSGYQLPTEPNHSINLGVRPLSVAITSDGQLAFVALESGNVAMLDIPGHEQLLATIHVNGDPHFIITGVYPPALVVTPAQAPILNTLVNIAGYGIVLILLIVPIILFTRSARRSRAKEEKAE